MKKKTIAKKREVEAKLAAREKKKEDDEKARKDKLKEEARVRAAEKAKREAEAKAKIERAKKAREEEKKKELEKHKRDAEAKTQNEKLEKAKRILKAEKQTGSKKEDKAKSKGVKGKIEGTKKKIEKEQKVKTEKPKPKFKAPTKKRFKIIDVELGSKEWIEWRHLGVGSSDADKVLSNQAKKLLQLKNTKADIGHSEELKLNIDLMQEARELYEEKSGLKVFPLCIQDKRFPWLQSSVDGISEDFSKLVKISCNQLSYKEAKKGMIPRALLQHQLMITGLEEIDYWCHLQDREGILITVKRDPEMINKLYEAEQEFVKKLNTEDRK